MLTNNYVKTIILLAGLFMLPGEKVLQAQTTLQKEFSVGEIRQRSLTEVLEAISDRGSIRFSYSNDNLPADSMISLSAFRGSLEDLLQQLLGDQYAFKEVGDYVIIRYAPKRLTPSIEVESKPGKSLLVQGQIKDAATQQGVPNVSVYDKHSFASTLSDKEGYYELEIKDPNQSVWMAVSKESYRDTTLVILMPVEVTSKQKPLVFRHFKQYAGEKFVANTVWERFFTNSKQRLQELNMDSLWASSRNYQTGILNSVRNGPKSLSIELDESGTLSSNFRAGGRLIYGILGVGYGINGQHLPYAVNAGFGFHLTNRNWFGMDAEIMSGWYTDFEQVQSQFSFVLLPGIKLWNHISLYAGPSLQVTTAYENRLKDVPKWKFHRVNQGKDEEVVFGPGLRMGLRYVWR